MSATAGYRRVFKPGLFAGQRFGVTGGGSGIGRGVAWRMRAPRPAKADRPPRGSSKVAKPHLLESCPHSALIW